MGHWSSADLKRPLSFGNVMRAHHNPEASFNNFFSAIRGLFGFSFYSLLALIGPLKPSCNQTQLTRIKVVWTEYNQRWLPVKLHLHNNYWWEVHDNMGKKSKCFSPNRAEEKKSPKTVLKSMHVSNKEYQKCASDWYSCLCFVKRPIYCASYQGPPLPTVRLSQTLFFGYLAGCSTWMELARHA